MGSPNGGRGGPRLQPAQRSDGLGERRGKRKRRRLGKEGGLERTEHRGCRRTGAERPATPAGAVTRRAGREKREEEEEPAGEGGWAEERAEQQGS